MGPHAATIARGTVLVAEDVMACSVASTSPCSSWSWRATRLITSPRGRGDSGALWASPWPTGMRGIYSQQGLRRRTECRARTPGRPPWPRRSSSRGQEGRQGTGRPLHHPGPVLSSERGGSGSGLDSVDGRPAALTALRRVSPSTPILVTHRRCRASIGGTYFYGSFLTDPASLPCRARPVWTERSSRIRGYLTAVMRR